MLFNSPIKECKKELADLYSQKHKMENEDEDIEVIPGSEYALLIQKIDSLIEGDYAQAVFDQYSATHPALVDIYTKEEVSWLDAFGDSFDKTTPGQRQALVGLIEGGSMYRFK